MKSTLLALSTVLFSFVATASMTEQDCQNQAKSVLTLLEMVEQGTMPVTEKQLYNLNQAKKHYDSGEYCAARSIVLNLNK